MGSFSLWQNYPNPFNPSTTIGYILPHRSHVTLTILNMLGQQVALLQKGDQDAGYREVTFSAGDGSGLSSGVYFYRIEARDLSSDSPAGAVFVQTMKLILLK
jgi:hypothetical protein